MAAPLYSANVRQVQSVVLAVPSLTTTDLVGFIKWLAAQPIRILAISVVVNAKTGTHVSTVIDVLQGVSVISTFDLTAVAAGTRVDGTLAAAQTKVAKGVEVSVNFTEAGGTTPVLTNTSIQIDYVPED